MEILKEVLKSAVKILNFIKENSINSRIFEIFCSEIGAQYTYCITQKFVCCQKAKYRVYELRIELYIFLIMTFGLPNWLTLLDICDILNDLNMKRLRKIGNIFQYIEYIERFQKILKL